MIKPPITDDAPAPFDRYLTEAQYARESGISRQSLKIARNHLTRGEDWEHPKGGSVYWSKLGVERLLTGRALASGGVSASALAKATLAIPAPKTRQDAPPVKQDPKEPDVVYRGLYGELVITSTPFTPYADFKPDPARVYDPSAAVEACRLILGGARSSKTEYPKPEELVIVPRGTLPVVWAIVHKRVPNPTLILVKLVGADKLTKVRVRADSQWMIGDRIQVRDVGREVFEYAGRAPRYRGEFGGTGKVK